MHVALVSVAAVASRVRVLARYNAQSRSPVQPIVYSAAVYPNDDDIHVAPVWSCSHEHRSAAEANECGLAWLERPQARSAGRA